MVLIDNGKGVALIIVLWIVVVLGSVAAAGAYLSRLELRQAYYAAREVQLVSAATAGIEKVKARLSADVGLYDSLKNDWSAAYADEGAAGDVSITVTVEDEESKFNLNTAAPDRLGRLPPLAGTANATEMIDALADWKDADAIPRPAGGEDGYYRALRPARACKNAPLDCIEELALVKGFNDPAAVRAIRKITTVSTDGKININTAPVEVLMTLPDVDYLLAQAVIARRNGGDCLQGTADDLPYDTVQKLEAVVGKVIYRKIENLITVKSSYFKIVVTAAQGRYSKTVEALLRRQGRNVQIKCWKES
jgi:general secretion pathway protein K